MDRLNTPSDEATDIKDRQNDTFVPTGWRKASYDMAQTAKQADIGAAMNAEKRGAIVAVKRVAAHIGLKAADLLLLDTLMAFSPPQDWGQGRRPIVWPSNSYLMEQTGFSLSTLKRHARRLAELGLVSFKDSPNGKRWGHRDRRGHIVEAYGFDLSPLAAHQNSFEALADELQTERTLRQQLKREITILRRSIRAMLDEEIYGDVTQIKADFETLIAQLSKGHVGSDVLKDRLEQFRQVSIALEETNACREQSLNHASDPEYLTSMGTENDPHTTTRKELKTFSCSSRDRKALSLNTILQASPEFSIWAKSIIGYLRNWSDLSHIISQLRPMVGITEEVWQQAQSQLGQQDAMSAFVLTFEKHCINEVRSPNGYLRGIAAKVGKGELNLARSFYGLLDRQMA